MSIRPLMGLFLGLLCLLMLVQEPNASARQSDGRLPQLAGLSFPNNYWWLSQHELLYIRQLPGKDAAYQIVRKTLPSGRETILQKLSRLYNTTHPSQDMDTGVSPDGRWFYWSQEAGNLFVARLDGSGLFQVDPSQKWASRLWSADSKAVIVLATERPYMGCWVERWEVQTHTQEIWHVAIPKKCDPSHLIALGFRSPTALLSRNALVVIDYDMEHPKPGMRLTLYTLPVWRTSRRLHPLRRYTLRLPRDVGEGSPSLADDGQQIAWDGRRTDGKYVLCLGRLGRSRMREVALLPGESQLTSIGLQWLPGGKQMSMIDSKNQLRIISVSLPMPGHRFHKR